jgi:hypothetical protein
MVRVGFTAGFRSCCQVRRDLGLGKLVNDESGTLTTLSLVVLAASLLISGLAIDVANAWRHREILQLSADVAADAGIISLARGDDPDDVRAAALAATTWNTPLEHYGRVVRDPDTDITLLHYDEATRTLSQDGPANAVRVVVQRSDKTRNPVPTFLLGLVGVRTFDIAAGSVSALLPTRSCSNAEGLFAQGVIDLQAPAAVGGGYCVHSQTAINLGPGVEFQQGARLSLPDLADCGGGCDGSFHPGADTAKRAINLQMPDLTTFVTGLRDGFLDPKVTLPQEAAFFANLSLSPDLSPVEEMQVDIESLKPGSVVTLTPMQFGKMRAFPRGLIYSVSCSPVQNSDNYSADLTLSLDGAFEAQVLKDLVLVTDCGLWFGSHTVIENSVILSTAGGSTLAFVADPGAVAGGRSIGASGGPAENCGKSQPTVLLSTGNVGLPSDFLGSNVALVAAGNVVLGPAATGAPVQHFGTTIHAGGDLQILGQNGFSACGSASSPLLPDLRVIRHVMTTIEVPVAPKKPEAVIERDLPGEKVAPLEPAPAVVGRNEIANSRGLDQL